MPLLDHFRPPLYPRRHWESFHSRWANAISDALNGSLLPAGYFSEVQIHVGGRVEVDIAAFELESAADRAAVAGAPGGGTATLTAPADVWAPPAPAMTWPAIFPGSVEALVYNMESGYTLVAAVELVSPGNKDRPDARMAFAAKCATYLREGVGLITVDTVTTRRASPHNDLVGLLGAGDAAWDAYRLPGDDLYAVAYRPIRRAAKPTDPPTEQIHVWPAPLTVGGRLPLLPLSLDRGLCVPLDLEATYTEARQRSRIDEAIRPG